MPEIPGRKWRSTLSFSRKCENISAILLRSVFLGTMNEIKWAFVDGPKTIAPDLFFEFSNLFNQENNLIDSYYEEIVKNNSKLHKYNKKLYNK